MPYPKVTTNRAAHSEVNLQVYLAKGLYSITVYDLKGKEISLLASGVSLIAQWYTFSLTGMNRQKGYSPAGTYIFLIASSCGIQRVRIPVL